MALGLVGQWTPDLSKDRRTCRVLYTILQRLHERTYAYRILKWATSSELISPLMRNLGIDACRASATMRKKVLSTIGVLLFFGVTFLFYLVAREGILFHTSIDLNSVN